MDQMVLNGRHRTTTGKSAAKILRQSGRIPAIMYDESGKSVMIDLDQAEFTKVNRLVTESTIVKVQLDNGEEHLVFVKDFQHDMVRNTIEHADLYRVDADKKLRAKIGIKLEGSPVGVRDGGVLEKGINKIDVECFPKDLLPKIVVDIAPLKTNESVCVKDLNLDSAINVLTSKDAMIAAIRFTAATVDAQEESAE